ncbi:hypothetical protein CABS01_16803 [Colletotrichum abscissum]|uniref:uncharacterized protein n=1 Tax=Colletotrichum abscissum TaxID=1671311 RepID=UPI0027D54F0F|nr:uncharacterized protein CABS01_16803 [Colletotrichum abscissum]KAK1512247.1 hypothetical protein CABS01_16803 [Colletotrichum abscissum]
MLNNTIVTYSEPETTPISEVQAIHCKLVEAENQCNMTIVTQFSKTDPMLSHEPWEAIVARHYMLLCEYYDFLSTTQDYSASPKLRELASKLAMPARLWEKGIRSLLDRLHGCLPESHDHMCTFIDLACFIMARVYRTVPAFESTWIEHLGDLGAYRIAMKDDHLQDREAWTSATRQWYSEASHRYPSIGRLYHRLAVCAKPNTLEQLFFYTKSLCVRVPFLDARDSLATFFEQNMNGVSGTPVVNTNSYEFNETPHIELTNEVAVSLDLSRADDGIEKLNHPESAYMMNVALRADPEDCDMVMIDLPTLDADDLDCAKQESPVAITVPLHDEGVIAAMDINTAFVRAHGLLFSGKDYDQFIAQSKILTEHLATSACQWTEDGYHISIVLSCALLEYGSESNPIMRIIKQGHADEGGLAMSHTPKADEMMPYPNQRFTHALGFVSRAHRAVFSSTGEEKTSSYLHVALVFLHHVSQFSKAMALVGDKMPWKGICSYLNMMMESCSSVQKMESDDLPHSVSQAVQPLPEDFALRGLLWAEKYYPDEWFSRIGADTDETDPPTGWMLQERADRCLWLGCRIAKSGVWLQYDKTVGRFRADSMFESEL